MGAGPFARLPLGDALVIYCVDFYVYGSGLLTWRPPLGAPLLLDHLGCVRHGFPHFLSARLISCARAAYKTTSRASDVNYDSCSSRRRAIRCENRLATTILPLRYSQPKSPSSAARGRLHYKAPPMPMHQTNCAAWLERRPNHPPRRAAHASRLSNPRPRRAQAAAEPPRTRRRRDVVRLETNAPRSPTLLRRHEGRGDRLDGGPRDAPRVPQGQRSLARAVAEHARRRRVALQELLHLLQRVLAEFVLVHRHVRPDVRGVPRALAASFILFALFASASRATPSTRCPTQCVRANFESGWPVIMRKHAADGA